MLLYERNYNFSGSASYCRSGFFLGPFMGHWTEGDLYKVGSISIASQNKEQQFVSFAARKATCFYINALNPVPSNK